MSRDGDQMTVAGDELWIRDGGGDGPAVVFIHGNSLSSESWERQLEAPELMDYRLIAFDLPGHGRSRPAAEPERRYSLPGYAELVAEFVRSLGIDEVVLVGHSLGGHIALEAAPSLPGLRGLFAFGVPPLSRPEQMPEAFQLSPALEAGFRAEVTREDAANVAGLMVAPGTEPAPWMVPSILATDGRARAFLSESIGAGKLQDELAIVRGLGERCAIVHLEGEQIVAGSFVKALEIDCWRGGIQTMACGHSPQWEAPAAFNALLGEFLQDAFAGVP